MGLQVRKMSRAPARRVLRAALLGVAMFVLAGCSQADTRQIKNLALPDRITEQGPYTYELWKWAWVAALATGVIVWGLIFYAVVKFRRRSDDEVPRQTRYNLPLEVFYTIAPVLMVIVFFFNTVRVQDVQTELSTPDVTVEVTGQQWSWTFNYGIGEQDRSADDDLFDDVFPYSSYVHESGTGSRIPTLVLPVGETTRFNLHSPDVIHGFGIPAFIMRMDVIPGRVNHYEITPTTTGVYAGRCYELCGVYHSRMLFKVKVVSREDYDAYLQSLQQAGTETDLPLIGGQNASTQAGLDKNEESDQ